MDGHYLAMIGGSSICFAVSMYLYIHSYQRADKQTEPDYFEAKSLLVFMLVLSTVLPVVSPVGLFLLCLVREKNVNIQSFGTYSSTQYKQPLYAKRSINSQDSELYQNNLLETITQSQSSEIRVKTVLASRGLSDKQAIPILKQAISDTVDDVRLTAYAIIENKEKSFNQQVQILTVSLDRAAPKQSGRIHHQLASLYWHICDIGLYEGEIQKFYLEKANGHVLEALKIHSLSNDLLRLQSMIQAKLASIEMSPIESQEFEEVAIDNPGFTVNELDAIYVSR